MERVSTDLAARGIDTVTFNFLYIEQGRRLPDSKDKLEACYRAVIAAVVHRKIGRGRLAIGGKSMGGRIASQVAAGGAPDVAGGRASRFSPPSPREIGSRAPHPFVRDQSAPFVPG